MSSIRTYVRVAEGIYQDPRTGNLYERPWIRRKRTWRKLRAGTLKRAKQELAAKRTRQAEATIGLGVDPYVEHSTLPAMADLWLEQACPDRKLQARAGRALKEEKARVTRLLEYFSKHQAREINAEDCRDYHAWRRPQIKRGAGNRTIDLELTTLSNMLAWAAQNTRKTGLVINPIAANRPRFQSIAKVRHSTAVMIQTDEELHRIARAMLSEPRSEALAWQLLLEALTGCRTSEILGCLIDAQRPREAGYQDSHALHIDRRKKGIEPWILLQVVPRHRPLAELLVAFRRWHSIRYPSIPHRPAIHWFIPGRNPRIPARVTSLSHLMSRICKQLEMPHYTSHGLRAYHVRVLRSLGIDDSEIAKRLGLRSGVMLIEKNYGVSEPGWFGGRQLDFLPRTGEPAWARWLPEGAKILPLEGNAKLRPRHTNRHTSKKPQLSKPSGVNRNVQGRKLD